jgi:hypothetical protein
VKVSGENYFGWAMRKAYTKAQGSMERLEQPPDASRLSASLRRLRRKDEKIK